MIRIHRAVESDANVIFDLHKHTDAFEVSEAIRFYELDELISWIKYPKDNIVLVAHEGDEFLGFLFCKVMSIHWGLLDNFFITPQARGTRAAVKLMNELHAVLVRNGIKYLSTLVKSDNQSLIKLCEKVNFTQQTTYRWLDKFIETTQQPKDQR